MVDHQLLVPPSRILQNHHALLFEHFSHLRLDVGQVHRSRAQGNDGFGGFHINETSRFRRALIVFSKGLIKIGAFGLVKIHESIGAATHKGLRSVQLARVRHVLPNMAGNNRHGPPDISKKGCVGPFEFNDHLGAVWSLDSSNSIERNPLVRMSPKVVHGKDHIVGCERLSIVPCDSFLQVKDKSHPVRVISPGLGQGGDIPLVVFPNQGFKDPAHANKPRPSWIVAIGIWISPITLAVSNANLIHLSP